MPSLIIDPGHGGSDPGANGFGALEKDWNLKISIYQYNRLKELGANVAITRTTDKTLDSVARTNLIKNKYDYCMSNHWNAFNGQARGIETIYSVFSKDQLAKRLANAVHRASNLPIRRYFKKSNSSGGDWYFMHRLTGHTTTIIVEYGFIDNKIDHDFYKNEKNFYAVAEEVVKEWCSILGIKYRTPKGGLTLPQYEELKKEIADLKRELANKLDAPSKSNTPSKWAEKTWEKSKEEGIFDGTRPKDYITRQEVASVVERIK